MARDPEPKAICFDGFFLELKRHWNLEKERRKGFFSLKMGGKEVSLITRKNVSETTSKQMWRMYHKIQVLYRFLIFFYNISS